MESKEMNHFETGAQREDKSEKSGVHLIPWDALYEVGKHYSRGGQVHGDYNWCKGLPLSSFLSSMARHMAQLQMGCTDEDHDLALAWNILGYIATKKRIQKGILPGSLDDRFKPYEDVAF